MSRYRTATRLQPVVLLGIFSKTQPGAISTVAKAFAEGLRDRYRFVPYTAERRTGGTRLAMLNPVNVLYFFKHLWRWTIQLLVVRPDIAHYPVTSYWNMEKSLLFLRLARLTGARPVGHLHGGAFVRFWKDAPRWRKWCGRRELRRLSAFIVLSEGWKKAIAQEVGLDLRNLFVVPNPIDADFERVALGFQIERAGSNILYLGALTPEKGILDLAQALTSLKDLTGWELTVVGEERSPHAREDFLKAVRRVGVEDRVRLIPSAWGNEKEEIFCRAAVFVLPSHTENLPLVLLEAAAAGLPIVTTPVGATPEILEDGVTAIFVPPAEPGRLGEALRSVLVDSEYRRRLGKNARAVFRERLSREHIMRSLESAYQRALE